MSVKILICDDEPLARDDMLFLLERDGFSLADVMQACDGEEAVSLIERHAPDILLLDMHMPRLDGIGVLKRLSGLRARPYCIVVSGYDDFEYAQGAMRFGASDYLLKPVHEQQFYEALERALDACGAGASSARSEEITQLEHELVRLRMENQAYRALAGGGDVPWPVEAMAVVIFPLRDDAEDEQATYRAYAVMDKISRFHRVALLRDLRARRRFLLFGGEAGLREVIRETAALIMDGGRRNFCAGVAAGMSNVALLHEGCMNALLARFQDERRTVFDARSDARPASNERMDDAWRALLEDIRRHAALMRSDTRAAFQQPVRRFLEQAMRALDTAGVQSLLERMHVSLNGVGVPPALDDYDQCGELAADLLRLLPQTDSALQDARYVIEEVRAHMREHFGEVITLRGVAMRFGVSPGYLSELFKQQTGHNFTDELTGLRMHRAQALLEGTGMRVGEIAHLCGYNSQTYFQHAYKKWAGCTPQEQRMKKAE